MSPPRGGQIVAIFLAGGGCRLKINGIKLRRCAAADKCSSAHSMNVLPWLITKVACGWVGGLVGATSLFAPELDFSSINMGSETLDETVEDRREVQNLMFIVLIF